MAAAFLIGLGVAVELFAVWRASRRDTHLELELVLAGIALFSSGLVVNIVSG